MKDKFIKWEKWIDVIYKEIIELSSARYIFNEVQEIIKSNESIQKPSAFYNFLANSYVAWTLSSIRRQVKIHKDSISLAALLKEMYEFPELITRERYIKHYKDSNLEDILGNLDFDRITGKDRTFLDPQIPFNDWQNLKYVTSVCEKYSDYRISHYDKRKVNYIPTFKDLNNCIDLLEELLKKYYLIFKATAIAYLPPIFQYDWKVIFTEKWMKENNGT